MTLPDVPEPTPLDPPHLDVRQVRVRLTALAAGMAILVALLVLTGWAFDIEALTHLHPAFVGMNPMTAACFLMLGAVLWGLRSGQPWADDASVLAPSSHSRHWIPALALLVALVGGLKVLEVAGLSTFAVDRLLFPTQVTGYIEALTGRPNRMAANTALNFVLLGLGVLFLARPSRRTVGLAQGLIGAVFLITLIPVVGFVYGTRALYGIDQYLPMAPHTAATFLVLIAGLLALHPTTGIMGVLSGRSLGGLLARRVLPVALLIPLLLGWLRLRGQALGLYSLEVGTTLNVVAVMALLSAFLLTYARLLHRADLARRAGERQLVTQAQELAQTAAYARAIADASKLLEHDLEPMEAARRTVHTVAQVADVDWGGVVRLDQREGQPWIAVETAWRGGALDPAAEAVLTTGVPQGQGMISVALSRQEPLYIENYAQQALAVPLYRDVGVQDAVFIPLAQNAQGLLALSFARLHTSRPWRDRDRELLAAAARIIAVSVERRANLDFMATAALSDVLTGLGNRRAFDLDLETSLADARRHGHTLGVMVLDLDGLKIINDQEGHARGDAYLQAFAQGLHAVFRSNDRIYRLGGDEYAVLLSHPHPSSALQILERVRRVVDLVRGGGFVAADVSAGLALYPLEAAEGSELVRLADERMYEEKRDHHLRRQGH